jgi:single-stranded DNA-binding protein
MNTVIKSIISKTVRNLSTFNTVNQVTLIGIVNRDPKISVRESTNSMDAYKNGFVSLLTNRNADYDGVLKIEADFHGVIVKNQELNEYIEDNKVSKGIKLYVNGEIQYSKDINNAERQYILAKDILIISDKQNYKDSRNGMNTENTVNQITLIGFIGNISTDQSKYSSNNFGSTISLSTSKYKGRDNDDKTKYQRDWHRVFIRDQDLNDFIQKPKLSKGDKIYVNGEIHNVLSKNNTDKFKNNFFIVANEISLISRKQSVEDNFENNEKILKENI